MRARAHAALCQSPRHWRERAASRALVARCALLHCAAAFSVVAVAAIAVFRITRLAAGLHRGQARLSAGTARASADSASAPGLKLANRNQPHRLVLVRLRVSPRHGALELPLPLHLLRPLSDSCARAVRRSAHNWRHACCVAGIRHSARDRCRHCGGVRRLQRRCARSPHGRPYKPAAPTLPLLYRKPHAFWSAGGVLQYVPPSEPEPEPLPLLTRNARRASRRAMLARSFAAGERHELEAGRWFTTTGNALDRSR